MPEPLKAALDQIARENGRSLTAEIVHRLEQSLSPTPLPQDVLLRLKPLLLTLLDATKGEGETHHMIIGKLPKKGE